MTLRCQIATTLFGDRDKVSQKKQEMDSGLRGNDKNDLSEPQGPTLKLRPSSADSGWFKFRHSDFVFIVWNLVFGFWNLLGRNNKRRAVV